MAQYTECPQKYSLFFSVNRRKWPIQPKFPRILDNNGQKIFQLNFIKNGNEISPRFRMEGDASMIIFSIYLNLQSLHFSFLQKMRYFSENYFLICDKNAEIPNFFLKQKNNEIKYFCIYLHLYERYVASIMLPVLIF